MTIAPIAAIGFALALDVFSVSAMLGHRAIRPEEPAPYWTGLHLALFHLLMPFGGWLLGREIRVRIPSPHYVYCLSLGLLLLLAANVMGDARRSRKGTADNPDSDGPGTLSLSLAGGVDGLCIGVIGATGYPFMELWQGAGFLAVVAAVVTPAGLAIGSRYGRRAGRVTAMVAGGVMVLIALALLAYYIVHFGDDLLRLAWDLLQLILR